MLNSSIFAQAAAALSEDHLQTDTLDSDPCSGSNSSFLANEKLMSVNDINSDVTGTFCCLNLVIFMFHWVDHLPSMDKTFRN